MAGQISMASEQAPAIRPFDLAVDDAAARPALLVAVFVVAVLPLLTTPMFPFIDFYNHLARYYVLAHLCDSPL